MVVDNGLLYKPLRHSPSANPAGTGAPAARRSRSPAGIRFERWPVDERLASSSHSARIVCSCWRLRGRRTIRRGPSGRAHAPAAELEKPTEGGGLLRSQAGVCGPEELRWSRSRNPLLGVFGRGGNAHLELRCSPTRRESPPHYGGPAPPPRQETPLHPTAGKQTFFASK